MEIVPTMGVSARRAISHSVVPVLAEVETAEATFGVGLVMTTGRKLGFGVGVAIIMSGGVGLTVVGMGVGVGETKTT